MQYFKSETTNRIIHFIDQCFYCKKIKECMFSQPCAYPFRCPDFDEDIDRIVGGPGINVEKENE